MLNHTGRKKPIKLFDVDEAEINEKGLLILRGVDLAGHPLGVSLDLKETNRIIIAVGNYMFREDTPAENNNIISFEGS